MTSECGPGHAARHERAYSGRTQIGLSSATAVPGAGGRLAPWTGPTTASAAVWSLAAPPADVYDALERAEDYPRWWPQVREVTPRRRRQRRRPHPLGPPVRPVLHRARGAPRPGGRSPGDRDDRRPRRLGALDRRRRRDRHPRPLRPGGRGAPSRCCGGSPSPDGPLFRANHALMMRAGTTRTGRPPPSGLNEARRDLYCSVRSRAISSVGERFVHTEEVTGSNPVSPTGKGRSVSQTDRLFLLACRPAPAQAAAGSSGRSGHAGSTASGVPLRANHACSPRAWAACHTACSVCSSAGDSRSSRVARTGARPPVRPPARPVASAAASCAPVQRDPVVRAQVRQRAAALAVAVQVLVQDPRIQHAAAARSRTSRSSDDARWRRNSRSSSVRSKGAFITTSGRPAAHCSASARAISSITGAGQRPLRCRWSSVSPWIAVAPRRAPAPPD